jgi:hypothetical protein
VNSFLQSGEVFVIWKIHHNPWWSFEDLLKGPGSPVDVFLNNDLPDNPGIYENPWAEPLNDWATIAYPGHVHQEGTNTGIYYLLKIENDSVLLGKKKAGDIDDYRVVDVMGSPVTPWNISAMPMIMNGGYLLRRKPHIFYGDTILGQRNHLTNADSSSWWVDQTNPENASEPIYDYKHNKYLLGSHPLDPVTGHLSNIFSIRYNVSWGFSLHETITGVSRGEDVATFLGNIIKADPAQDLSVIAPGGSEKGMTDAVTEGDILVVTSETGNVTQYAVSTAAIGGNPSLTALDTSVLVTSSAPYEIGGFAAGTSLRWILGKVVKAEESAVINVVNMDGEPVPLRVRNSREEYMDVRATDDLLFEVVAEDGTTRSYALVPSSHPAEAYILSDVYEVVEEPFRILGEVPRETGVKTLLDGLIPAKGAGLKLVKATGQERTIGLVAFGDRVAVTSSDGTRTVDYRIRFKDYATAYVTSSAYAVDQDRMVISEVDPETELAVFLGNLSPSEGSGMMLMDPDGNQKTTGWVQEKDVLKVMTADGTSRTLYTISFLTAVTDPGSMEIGVYPNPATEVLYIENLPADSYVRISNMAGHTILLRKAGEVSHGIGLKGLEEGVYLLSVESEGEKIMATRFVRR